jgi:polyhydroxyalkanoate synthesis regulator phasin
MKVIEKEETTAQEAADTARSEITALKKQIKGL